LLPFLCNNDERRNSSFSDADVSTTAIISKKKKRQTSNTYQLVGGVSCNRRVHTLRQTHSLLSVFCSFSRWL
jgi:hypothetical protein